MDVSVCILCWTNLIELGKFPPYFVWTQSNSSCQSNLRYVGGCPDFGPCYWPITKSCIGVFTLW